VGYLIYHYVYPEFLFEALLKEKIGGNLTLECWGYQFISTHTSLILESMNYSYTNLSLTLKQQVDYLRELLNQNYINFTESTNITNPDHYIMDLLSQASSISLVESIYAILKDILPDAPPKTCKIIRSNEDVSRVLSNAMTMVYSGKMAFEFVSITVDRLENCMNTTNKRECVDNYINSFKIIADEKKNSLPTYKEIKLSKCLNTLVYLQLKDLEKETRNQLVDSEDPFSIMWKSLQIDMYDKCSQRIHDEFITKYRCPIIPLNKIDSVEVVISTAGIFVNCSSTYLIELNISQFF